MATVILTIQFQLLGSPDWFLLNLNFSQRHVTVCRINKLLSHFTFSLYLSLCLAH